MTNREICKWCWETKKILAESSINNEDWQCIVDQLSANLYGWTEDWKC